MRLMILLALLLVSGSLSAQTQGAIKRVCHVSRFELAVACIKKYEGLHGPKHHPYEEEEFARSANKLGSVCG